MCVVFVLRACQGEWPKDGTGFGMLHGTCALGRGARPTCRAKSVPLVAVRLLLAGLRSRGLLGAERGFGDADRASGAQAD